MSDINASNMNNLEFAVKWRQTRACARCRRLKMKCAFEDPSFESCKRCFSVGVQCSFDNDPTAKFAKKKNRKATKQFIESVSPGITSEAIVGSRNGDQISQLQNLVKLVTTAVSSLEHDISVTSTVSDNDTDRLEELNKNLLSATLKLANLVDNSESGTLKQFQDFHKSPSLQDCPYIPFNSNIAREIVEKHELVSLEEIKIRHQFFLTEMLPYYPIISFSEKLQDFDYLYDSDPLLLLGCVYVTTINDNGLYSRIKESYYKLTNEALNQMLNYYLESFISYHVYIKSDDFSYRLVELCLILSLWCLPTTTSGHFKNQFHLLIGFNISLCIDLGDISKNLLSKMSSSIPVLPDDSEQRNHLRAFLSVYVSCGSLGLSLPRFKLVTWNKQHHTAVHFLMKEGEVNGVKLPSRNDRYLCYFAKIIRLGQELFDYFTPSLFLEVNSNRKKDILFANMLDPTTSSLPHVKFVLDNYEQKIYSLLVESGFMESPEPESGKSEPKEKYLLSVIYYQLLMIIYDNIVSRYFILENKNPNGQDSVTYVQYIIKLIKLSENLLRSFIILGQERTINLPTFFFYRPMHALILLVKLRILINSSQLAKKTEFINPEDLKINAETYYKGVYSLIHESQHKYSSIVCLRMAIILSRIEKWMNLSNTAKDSKPRSKATVERESSNLVNLIDTSKEIENLRAPKEDDDSDANLPSNPNSNKQSTPEVPIGKRRMSYGMYNNTTTPSNNFSIQDIFETIDSDLLNYLNPLEANIDFDANFSSDFANVVPNFNPLNMYNGQNMPMNPNVGVNMSNAPANMGPGMQQPINAPTMNNNINGSANLNVNNLNNMGGNGGSW